MTKKLLLKITLSILAILLVSVVIIVTYPKQNNQDGTITVIAIDKNSLELFNDEISFSKTDGKNLYELISAKYTCEVRSGMLLKIGELEAYDTSEYFIKILKNDELSNRGILEMTYKDKDVIKFIYTKTGDLF